MREPTYDVSYVILQEPEYDNEVDRAARGAVPLYVSANFVWKRAFDDHKRKYI